jgi:WD40 repeat protein
MAKVFVSYSRKDMEFAKRLTGELQKSDLDFWIDWEGIPPTVDWWKEIEKGIEEADTFLFLISPYSAKSKICKKEVTCAVKNSKRIIPVVVRDIPSAAKPPAQLRQLNWIFFRKEDNFKNSLRKLLTAIHSDYEWAATHRRLQVKALDWERNDKENGFLLRGVDLLDAEQDLATNTSKDPHPTDLQREYVLESRRATDRQRRITSRVAIGGVVVLAVLAVAAAVMAVRATTQAKIALARQLSAQSQSLYVTGNSKQVTAVLLAARATQLFPLIDSAQVLQRNTLVAPLSHIALPNDEAVTSVAASPDGKYLVATSSNETLRVWETTTGNEIGSKTADGVQAVAVSPDGKYIGLVDWDSTQIWETATMQERFRFETGGSVVAISPNSRYLASVSDDWSIRVWEITNGKEVAHLIHDGVATTSIAFSPDNKQLISSGCNIIVDENFFGWGCPAGTTIIWDISTGREIASLAHSRDIRSIAFSPNGELIVTGEGDDENSISIGGEDTVRVFDARTGEELHRMSHDSGVNSVAFSPDSKLVVSGSDDNTARVWDVATGREISRMTHDDMVVAVTFSPDSLYAGSASWDHTARVWEASTGNEAARMTHDDALISLVFSQDGRKVISGSPNDGFVTWEAIKRQEISQLTHDGIVNSFAISSDGKLVVSGSGDNTVRVWDIATGREITRWTHQESVVSVAFSPNDKYVASSSLDNTARVWDVASGKEIARMVHDVSVYPIAFSPDSKVLVSGGGLRNAVSWPGSDGTARVWEISTGTEITRMLHENDIKSVAFSPDGKFVVSGSDDNTARIWESKTGTEIARMTHDDAVSSVAFSPDGRYVISGSWDGDLRIWVAATGKQLVRMQHDGIVEMATFSPSGKYALSGGGDNTARIWEVATGKEITRMIHEHPVLSVAFSPDGKYAISGDGIYDPLSAITTTFGTARIWEVETGKEIARMAHEYSVTSVAFTPDGKYAASGGGDHVLRIWVWQAEDLIANACAVLSRNLTRDEWDQYIGDASPYPTRPEDATCPELPVELESTPTPMP